MFGSYKKLFSASGTLSFSVSALISRISLPMTGIGIITMLSQLHGSYSLAGAVSALFVFTYAILSPQISRLVDQKGQRKILPLATIISTFGILIILISAWVKAPNWTLFLGAVLAGFMPSMSAMARARWTEIYRGKSQLQTAYSLETVFDEISFITGPPLSVLLSVIFFPQAGLFVSVLLLLIGVFTFTAQVRTEPKIKAQILYIHSTTSVIRNTNIQLLTLLLMTMGIIVGTVDIVSVAFAEHIGNPAAASFVLSAYAIGSCLAGLVFGTLKFKMPLNRLLLIGGLATAATTLPLILVNSIFSLAVSVLIAGLFFAPTMIVAMSLVENMVPENQLTESLTWLLAGLNVGVAIGAATSGQFVDIHGANAGFFVSLVAGGMILSIVLLGYRRLGV